MTLTGVTQNPPALAESLSLTQGAESAQPEEDACNTSPALQLNQVVGQIAHPKVKEIVGTVFEDLLRMLECLGPVEDNLHQVDDAEETFALFQSIHDEACALVKFIREDALNCKALDRELRDTLDAITFAVSHDLRRVFDTKPADAAQGSSGRVVVGKMFRAHEVLTNCLQQATISLAIMFDPELVGTKLFHDSDRRYRQSLQLCEDLSTLTKLVEACAQKPIGPALTNLSESIERFRNESMENLRYSDWPEFESFCEKLEQANPPSDVEPVLHQFACFLETLLGQVKMRSVLASEVPIQFGADDIHQESSPPKNWST
ncbi:MAG: hypothetical protein LC775_07800, partial [Acidobacteria bacterium]|nr:hypothetical protein [Acidobacteriota bacterium]